ncbi:MAG: uroporphyrinogen decarboxylase family protein [Candidatus Zipacnadales bacterium]
MTPPPMTFRERLLTGLRGERTDVLPWFADLSYWYSAQAARGNLPDEYQGDEGFVKLHVDYHVGYYLGYASLWTESTPNVTLTTRTDGNLTTTIWQTPIGLISGRTQFLPETHSSAPIEWPVKSPDDLRVLRYIADAVERTPTTERYEALLRVAGDQGHPTVLPPRSPVSQMLAQWTGATNLAYLLADARHEVERTLHALARSADSAFEAILASDVPYVEFGDNLTGEVVTRLFERYQFDYYVQRVEQLHAAGKLVGTHLDGTLRGILPLLVQTGLDFIESITPQPIGDVAIVDLRDLAGPNVVLFGGLPGAMFAPPFTADDLRRQVEEVIEHHWPYGRFILGVADQVPPNGNIDLVRLVGELCEELSD